MINKYRLAVDMTGIVDFGMTVARAVTSLTRTCGIGKILVNVVIGCVKGYIICYLVR